LDFKWGKIKQNKLTSLTRSKNKNNKKQQKTTTKTPNKQTHKQKGYGLTVADEGNRMRLESLLEHANSEAVSFTVVSTEEASDLRLHLEHCLIDATKVIKVHRQ
jgi:hypothetical protein